MTSHRRLNSGFSLAELIVVCGIVGLMAAFLAAGLERSQDFARTEMSRSAVESKFQQTNDHLRRLLAIARVDEPIASGTRLRVQMPIDHDGDGLAYDAAGQVTWGFSVGGTPTLGADAWLSYEVDETVHEAHLGLDVNHDGDRADEFDLGHLEEQFPDGTIVRLTGSTVLQNAGDPGGDLDLDGTVDPLFSITEDGRARLVRLRFFGLYRLADGRFERLDYDSAVRLQNDTQ